MVFLFLGKTQFLRVNLINTNHQHEAIIFFRPGNGFTLQQLCNCSMLRKQSEPTQLKVRFRDEEDI